MPGIRKGCHYILGVPHMKCSNPPCGGQENLRIDRIKHMISFLHRLTTRRFLLLALPLAIFLTLFFPAVASAHAILLRSDPVADSQLNIAPQQVRMWFSEALNPAFSTA